MSLHILPDLEQGSDEWHNQRRGMVTASVVGRLITAKTIKPADNEESRLLTRLLVAERITGYTDPTYRNEDMWRGVEEEPRAREKYSEHYGREVTTCGFMVNDDSGHSIGYSPDGLVGDEGLLEIKAPRAKEHLRTILADEVPALYMAQLQCGLVVSGREWIDYVSWSGGMPMYVKRVLPNPDWYLAIHAAVERFEQAAAEMLDKYEAVTRDMPATERLELVVI